MSSVTLIEKDKDTEYSDCGLSLEHKTRLQDTKQIVVDTFKYENSWNNITNNWTSVRKEPIKVIVKELHYSFDWTTNKFELQTIVVLGFRKDKKVRASEDYLNKTSAWNSSQFQDIISQIPDSFHDNARESFIKMTNEVQEKLNQTITNGVTVS